MRLDILIYAHDGRGLGHVSRSIGIGMALRRLYPELKILFISGSSFTSELLGHAPLDWLKLPAYKTEVVDGISKGVSGDSLFSDKELGELRSLDFFHVVTCYQPRLVLVDHTPQGKHGELLQALEGSPEDCQWVLGVRGIVGEVKQAKAHVTRKIFQKHYSDLLWYGDSAVLGSDHSWTLQKQYGLVPFECGYVSRLGEFVQYNSTEKKKRPWAGVVSIPWLGEKSLLFLECLAGALAKIPTDFGLWCLFVDTGDEVNKTTVDDLFSGLSNCRLKQPGKAYAEALMNAKSAVIYGGYNSLIDVLSVGIPTVVILREMQDQEQQAHVKCLQEKLDGFFISLSEGDISVVSLSQALLHHVTAKMPMEPRLKVDGATRAASYLYAKLV